MGTTQESGAGIQESEGLKDLKAKEIGTYLNSTMRLMRGILYLNPNRNPNLNLKALGLAIFGIKHWGRKPRKRGTPTRSRYQQNATGWSSGFSRAQRESEKSARANRGLQHSFPTFPPFPIWCRLQRITIKIKIRIRIMNNPQPTTYNPPLGRMAEVTTFNSN